jgi:hypothetical protein
VRTVAKLKRGFARRLKEAALLAAREKLSPLFTAIALMRARREEEVSVGYAGVASCIMAGIIMAIAKPLATWITGIDVDNPPAGMEQIAPMISKLLTLITYLGVVLMVLGIIWAGINLARRRED